MCVVSSPALADVGTATISDVNGKVLVNAGEGFVPAAADMVLKSGDRVFVGEQSLATLSYATCELLLDKPTVVTVTADGGCKVATSIQPVAVAGLRSGNFPVCAVLPTIAMTGMISYSLCNALFKRLSSISAR